MSDGPSSGIAFGYDAVVCDIDGVLAHGHTPVDGAAEVLAQLRAGGVAVRLVTNNASRTPADVAAWLGGLGFAVTAAEVLTSSVAAAGLFEPGTRCLVIGTSGLRTPLGERGCVLVDDPGQAQAVVVGIDPELTYQDLRRATLALHAGARFVATNTDVTLPTDQGLWPGNGAVVAFLEAATGRVPEVAGKPHPPLFEAAAADLRQPERILMVGDRVETDIDGARALGWDTALVLSGVTGREQARTHRPAPTYVLDSVRELLSPAPLPG